MNRTKIPWANYSWNPITGCSPKSEGCHRCYARAIANRFHGGDFGVKFHAERLGDPRKARKPGRIFVCSTSDFWHPDVDPAWRHQVECAMACATDHTYIFLTKRPENIPRNIKFGENVWIGVTTENQARYDERWSILQSLDADVRFVSVEPMLGPVTIRLAPFSHYRPTWVIAGPETGPGHRPCQDEWIDDLSGQSRCFFDKRAGAGRRREWPR